MKQNLNKDKWIEEVLSSADNIQRAQAGQFIFSKILNRIKENNRSRNIIPIKRAAVGFITILLLGVINLLVIFSNGNTQVNTKTTQTNPESSTKFIPSQYNPYLEILNEN